MEESISLIMKDNINTLHIKNIILIDKTVEQSELFFSSNNDETLSIYYNYDSDRDRLFDYLEKTFIKIDRIGIIFDNSNMSNKYFLNNEPFFTEDDLIHFENNNGYENYSSNVNFLIKLCKKFSIKYIDFLVCYSLEYNNWKIYYNFLQKETNIIVGASSNKTGNSQYGVADDWIMETTNENIQNIYFNENIVNYTSALDFINTYMIIKKNDNLFYATSALSRFITNPNNVNYSFYPMFPSLPIGYDTNSIVKIYGFTASGGTASEGTLFVQFYDNKFYTCGENTLGQAGVGITYNRNSGNVLREAFTSNYPSGKVIKSLHYFRSTFLLMTDNTVYCCGNNTSGVFGNGTTSISSSLVQAFTSNYPSGKIIKSLHYTYASVFLLMTDNTVYGCGSNSNGQLGIGTIESSVPSLVQAFTSDYPFGKIIKNLYTCSNSVFVEMTDNTFYCCGNNTFGIFGNLTVGVNENSTGLVQAFTTLPEGETIKQIFISRRLSLIYTNNNLFFNVNMFSDKVLLFL
jgi:hypothetical protein